MISGFVVMRDTSPRVTVYEYIIRMIFHPKAGFACFKHPIKAAQEYNRIRISILGLIWTDHDTSFYHITFHIYPPRS